MCVRTAGRDGSDRSDKGNGGCRPGVEAASNSRRRCAWSRRGLAFPRGLYQNKDADWSKGVLRCSHLCVSGLLHSRWCAESVRHCLDTSTVLFRMTFVHLSMPLLPFLVLTEVVCLCACFHVCGMGRPGVPASRHHRH